MSPAAALLRALDAERLKLRRTLALRMSLVTPTVVVVLCFLQIAVSRLPEAPPPQREAWASFAGASFALWAFLMLPLFATLEAALLAGLEHGERQWKHLLALPLPRWTHYAAKWVALLALMVIGTATMAALIVVAGKVLGAMIPELGLVGWPPWAWLARRCAGMLVASLLLATIQLWVSLRWGSFTVAVAAGMTATVAGFMIGQSRWGHFYPWTLPVQLFAAKGAHAAFAQATSAVGAAVVLALACWDLSRRELE